MQIQARRYSNSQHCPQDLFAFIKVLVRKIFDIDLKSQPRFHFHTFKQNLPIIYIQPFISNVHFVWESSCRVYAVFYDFPPVGQKSLTKTSQNSFLDVKYFRVLGFPRGLYNYGPGPLGPLLTSPNCISILTIDGPHLNVCRLLMISFLSLLILPRC